MNKQLFFKKDNKLGLKHGHCKEKIYKTWQNIKSRCNNPNAERYECYGGRGIKMCNGWFHDFMSFYDWAINNGYKSGLSIERINVNGNYEPSNCKWIPKEKQSLNTRRNIYITHNGEIKCLQYWCNELNLKINTIIYRARTLNGDYETALFNYTKYKKGDKKFCKNGHEYTKENTVINSVGFRVCKTCQKINAKANKLRRKHHE